ncbi:MAG: holo-ACP synthase [Proteobacteria bacterium]|nr:holo-ACP synthase [Pseudomonadota bacterium]
MILGIGVEWLEVPRFEAALRRFGPRLRERLFTEAEQDYAAGRAGAAQSLAVRFAAKAAGRRALGRPAVRWRDLEVVRSESGAPALAFHGAAERAARELGVKAVTLSLTHDASYCLGQVILEGRR